MKTIEDFKKDVCLAIDKIHNPLQDFDKDITCVAVIDTIVADDGTKKKIKIIIECNQNKAS